jgi:RHS repeat-associated protein
VSHSYAGGIDRPLVITKLAVATVVPHQNWRGMFATATTDSGAVSGVAVNWPGFETTPWHTAATPKPNWFGSVASGMRDGSGLIYMRNRYYNPATGQFTQPDPIGLAGGLNSYGFAAGDPVGFWDPFGLKVCYMGTRTEVRSLVRETERSIGARVEVGIDNCVISVGNSNAPARDEFLALVNSGYTYSIAFGTRGSRFDPLTRTIWLDPADEDQQFYSMRDGQCQLGPIIGVLSRILAHELGHAYELNRRFGVLRQIIPGPLLPGARRRREASAMRWENAWAREHRQPERCQYGPHW